MQVGNYTLSIPEGQEDSQGYITLSHGKVYTIAAKNLSNRRSTAVVSVDGKEVGVFRLNTYASLSLEHPSGDNGRFTFYKDGTAEAVKAELHKVNKNDRGLVSVTFKPERPQPEPAYESVEDVGHYPIRGPGYPTPLLGTPRGPQPIWKSAGGQHTNSVRSGVRGQSVDGHESYMSMQFAPEREIKTSSTVGGGTGLSGSSGQRFRTVAALEHDDPSTFVTITLRLVAANEEPRPLKVKGRSNPVPNPV